jgi:hypothetical protein
MQGHAMDKYDVEAFAESSSHARKLVEMHTITYICGLYRRRTGMHVVLRHVCSEPRQLPAV